MILDRKCVKCILRKFVVNVFSPRITDLFTSLQLPKKFHVSPGPFLFDHIYIQNTSKLVVVATRPAYME